MLQPQSRASIKSNREQSRAIKGLNQVKSNQEQSRAIKGLNQEQSRAIKGLRSNQERSSQDNFALRGGGGGNLQELGLLAVTVRA